MNSSIIHDNISSLVHKKPQLKNNHSDIKYLMILDTTLSVVLVFNVEFEVGHACAQ